MHRPCLLALAALAALFARGVRAEPAAPALTVSEVVQHALTRSPAMAAAEARVMAAEGERARARLVAPSNPELGLRMESDRLFDDTGERAWEVELSQELWAPGQRRARMDAAAAALAAAEADRAWTIRQVALAAATAHVRTAVIARKEAILRDLLDVLLRLDDAAGQRFAAGDMSEFERNQVRIETAAGLAELTAIGAEASAARADMDVLLGEGWAGDRSLAVPEPVEWGVLQSLAITASVENRPDVVAAASRVERAEGRIAVERLERRPRPTVSVGWASERSVLLGDDFVGLPFPADGFGVRDEGDALSVGVELAIPLVDRRRGEIMEATAERLEAEADLILTRRSAAADQRRLLDQGRALSAAMDVAAGATAAGEANLQVLEAAWAEGQLSLDDVLRERNRVLTAMLGAEDIRLAQVQIQLELAAALGSLRLFGVPAEQQPRITPSAGGWNR